MLSPDCIAYLSFNVFQRGHYLDDVELASLLGQIFYSSTLLTIGTITRANRRIILKI